MQTHPVVEGVLGAGHAAVVAAVGLGGHHAGGVEGAGEGGGGGAGRRVLAEHRGGAGRGVLQGQRGIRTSSGHLLSGRTHV